MDKCADACTSTSIEQPCGGTVLRCLTEKMEDIADAECKKEVFYFVKMEARRASRRRLLGRQAGRCQGSMLPHGVMLTSKKGCRYWLCCKHSQAGCMNVCGCARDT